jgi:hypothetical protein
MTVPREWPRARGVLRSAKNRPETRLLLRMRVGRLITERSWLPGDKMKLGMNSWTLHPTEGSFVYG